MTGTRAPACPHRFLASIGSAASAECGLTSVRATLLELDHDDDDEDADDDEDDEFDYTRPQNAAVLEYSTA
jgi:hypothetical protein